MTIGPLALSETLVAALITGLVAVSASTITTWVVGKQNRRLEEARWAEARRAEARAHVLDILRSTEAWVRMLGQVLVRLETATSREAAYEAIGIPDTSEGAHGRILASISALKLSVEDDTILAAADALAEALHREPSIVVPAFDQLKDGASPTRATFDAAHRRCDELQQLADRIAAAAAPTLRGPVARN